ncbi:malonyl-CoA decarboxylase domain-containing protein [Glacieibacterium sp.]|uniref:malonyl-CoA decarboxylase domain-containing protein n=1 Tax=Glacieibacterium sp. TaxID=2860237 RepID=UPI003AFFC639
MAFAWMSRLLGRDQSQLQKAIELSKRLVSGAGETGGTIVAQELANCTAALNDEELFQYFRWLVDDMAPDQPVLLVAAQAYVSEPSTLNAARLTEAAEPRRQELLRRLNTAPGGTARIVALRGKLLTLLKAHPELKPLDIDMKHLLASWFNRGFLELRRVDWNTPAAILEKLIVYEAVHAIDGWDDLRGRLAADRRCYGFFHPALPGEPLIFVEVALTNRISDAIAPLLDHPPAGREASPETTAIFYSISNCQPGLRGIGFGNFLIKQITQNLRAETPSLRVFATLSPVPGFRRWLDAGGQQLGTGLARLCAMYLSGVQADGTPGPSRDPVANFHLSNGARLDRINEGADLSAKGQAESCGVMVNYRYVATAIEENHMAFVERGEVRVSPAVARLLRSSTIEP